jgi:hypothetical protein
VAGSCAPSRAVRQLCNPPFSVLRARKRCQKGDEIVDFQLGQRKRLDVFVEIGVLQPVALVVVVDNVP